LSDWYGGTGARVTAALEEKQQMPYPESFIGPMRQELTRLGVKELRSPDAVDALVRETPGTLMVVVNSMCGCAAGRARPGVALALQHHVTPDVVATVFAGGDIEATERARGYFAPYRPSSPSIAILRGGKLVYMLERQQIENQSAENIARALTDAFDKFCAPTVH
jgi:putative YphP/YqiW family bacilliredoxin